MSLPTPAESFDLFRLLEALEAQAAAASSQKPLSELEQAALKQAGLEQAALEQAALEQAERVTSTPASLEASFLGSQPLPGRIFRVKPGYNPNSSSLGTSVVTLLWGVGLAGVLFQLVGQWLLNQAAEGKLVLSTGEGEGQATPSTGGSSTEPVQEEVQS